jgi:hypothetical protein
LSTLERAAYSRALKPGRRDTLWPGTLLAAAVAFLACFLALRERLLPGADSYYHLAIAREIAAHGLPHDLPWARFSAMHQGFGDKEVLFHLLLAPFAKLAAWPDPRLGGALALAFFVSLLAAALAWLGARAAGGWGLAVPFLLVFTSTEAAERWLRLRPELLSLLLLLLFLWSAARRRYRLAGGLAALYALSYTAFHALLGLAALVFLFFGWVRRRWEWGLPLYALLGTGIGLVVHPHFPKNLEIWVLQNVYFFRLRDSLDVGSEIFANPSDELLIANLAWFLTMAVLWCSPGTGATATGAERDAGTRGEAKAGADGEATAGADHADGVREAESRGADVFAIAAAVFGVLYLLMSRFATYFFPFATLWTLFELRRRGRAPGRWIVLGGRRLPLAAVLGACLLVGLPPAARWLGELRAASDPGPRAVRIADRAALSRALPAGARVAARWPATPPYIFWAPQAFYLNVLDPVFMAVPYPQAYGAQRAVFAGDEPDVPLVVAARLASDYIACEEVGAERLIARLAADPRVAVLHRGINAAFHLLPAANRAFVLDWQERPGRAAYPRLPPGRGGEIEGYVNARRMTAAGGCIELTHREEVKAPLHATFEFSPSGPSRLALDGHTLAATSASLHAVLGRGLILPVALGAGPHLLSVLTCPDAESPSRTGFYLLARDRRP